MWKHVLVVYNFILILDVLGEVEVETTHGRIYGAVFQTLLQKRQYYGFMGIPYAAPPVKSLRFKPPQSVDPWTNVLHTKKLKPACIQFNINIIKSRTIGQYGVEDCLYLDVFTPAIDRNKRPVIVFLYNELFQNSYNKTNDYGPDFFIEEDIITVTISHRLSLFGFLSFEDNILPGNSGLKDIAAAIEWVANNIAYFGGDPNRLTLMGSQGGAVAIDLLLHTKVKPFINSAILQSGTSLNPLYLQEKAQDRGTQLGKLSNIYTSNKTKLLQELSELPAADLLSKEIKAVPVEYYKENQRGVLPFGPIVETDPSGLVTEYPENGIQDINIPLMIGLNSREGLTYSVNYLVDPEYLRFANKDFPFLVPLRLKYKFDPNHADYYEAIEEIKKHYFSKTITERSISDIITYMGDVLSSYAIDKMVRTYSKVSSEPVYYYMFNYYSDLNENKNNLLKLSEVEEGTWGAAIGDELCYLFKCPELTDKYAKYQRVMSEEMIMQRKLIKLWSNFVKFGNPTPEKDNPLIDLKWPQYNEEDKIYLHLDKQIELKRDLFKNNFEFWDRFINKWEMKAKSDDKKDEL